MQHSILIHILDSPYSLYKLFSASRKSSCNAANYKNTPWHSPSPFPSSFPSFPLSLSVSPVRLSCSCPNRSFSVWWATDCWPTAGRPRRACSGAKRALVRRERGEKRSGVERCGWGMFRTGAQSFCRKTFPKGREFLRGLFLPVLEFVRPDLCDYIIVVCFVKAVLNYEGIVANKNTEKCRCALAKGYFENG